MTKVLPARAAAASARRLDPAAELDVDVVRAATGRAPLMLDDIYRDHAAVVARWVSRLTGPDIDAEDIVQEIFLVVHKRLHTFRGDAQITTWLYGITLRVVTDRRRARRWRRWFGFAAASDTGHRHAVQSARAGEATPLEAIEQAEAQRAIYQILDGLSEDHRTVLILFELQGLSGQQIADITGIAVSNVWLRLHRARKQFSQRFLQWEAASEKGAST